METIDMTAAIAKIDARLAEVVGLEDLDDPREALSDALEIARDVARAFVDGSLLAAELARKDDVDTLPSLIARMDYLVDEIHSIAETLDNAMGITDDDRHEVNDAKRMLRAVGEAMGASVRATKLARRFSIH